MSSEHQITLTEFEKIAGIPNQTISRAISQAKIPAQFVVKTGERRPVYIQPHAAAVSWLKNLQGTTQKTHELRKKLEEYIKTFLPEENEKESKQVEKAALKGDKSGIPTYSESQNKERHFKAQLAELEYREKQGSLIDKAQAQFQLFTIGKEIRNSMLAIPDRIADDCFAAQNRAKLHSIIYEAIEFELTRIADLGNAL